MLYKYSKIQLEIAGELGFIYVGTLFVNENRTDGMGVKQKLSARPIDFQ